jgi:hypothetical protein
MNIRKSATVIAITCAALLAVPMMATAAVTHSTAATTSATSFKHIPVTGKATKNGKTFTGSLTVSQFVTRAGKPYAVGTLTGRIGKRAIKATQVALPTQIPSSTGLAGTADTCQILHLDLGPLNLNLLGLRVHLNEVVLNITAQSGPGLLLGNLLCGVAHLLDQGPVSTSELAGLLNIVQNLTQTTGLLNL